MTCVETPVSNLMAEFLDRVRGCTFDDFLFTPQHSVLERRDPASVDLSCRLSEHLTPQRSNGVRSMVERIRSDARMEMLSRLPLAVTQRVCSRHLN